MFSKSVYDVLKLIQRVALPAANALFAAIAASINLPCGPVIESIVAGFITFLGALLAIDAAKISQYKSETTKEKIYDILKYIQRIYLPAAIALYGVLAFNLGWPHTDLVISIGNAVITFMGTLLGIDSARYYAEKRAMMVAATADAKTVEDVAMNAFVDVDNNQ